MDGESVDAVGGGSAGAEGVVVPVFLASSGFHLAGVTVRNGHAYGNGAGVRISPYVQYGDPAYSMTDCAFESCIAIAGEWPEDKGAAVSIAASDWAVVASLSIDRCAFEGNSGGGLHCEGVWTLSITGTRFIANINCPYGSLTVWECGDVMVDRCELGFNHGLSAGALSLIAGFPTLLNCLVHNNVATTGHPAGLIDSSVCKCFEIRHSTFVGNAPTDRSQVIAPLFVGGGFVRNSILWDDGTIQFVHTIPLSCSLKQGGWEKHYDNTNADPMFVDPENHDYRLLPESPLIDYCFPQDTICDSLDLDGNPRMVDVPNVGCGPMKAGDLGCFEHQLTPQSASDCDGDGAVDTCQILSTPLLDCDGDGVLDACAIAAGLVEDCDGNGVPDACQGTAFAASANCLRMPGDGASAVIPGFCNVMPTTEITIELWQWIEALGAAATFWTHLADTNRCLLHAPFTDGKVYWDFGLAVIPNGRLSYTPPEPIVGSWQHFALQASNEGGFMRIYRNGVLEAEKSGAETFILNANSLKLGGTAGDYFDGMIDELRIWDHIRTAEEVQQSMSQTVDPASPGLVGYWRFDEGSGSLGEDLAGSHDAVLTGSAHWVAALDCPPSPDLNGDGIVDGADLGTLLSAWGPVPSGSVADLNSDGAVDGADLGVLLAHWG